jgi:hypothetical protein
MVWPIMARMLWGKCRQVNESGGVGGISRGLLAKNRHITHRLQIVKCSDEATRYSGNDIGGSDRNGPTGARQFTSARSSAGKWLLQGTVGKQPVTHDFDAEWVLQHHYLRFFEVSREKSDKGEPQYEATVFVGWNEKTKQYACAWMDVYGGLTTESIGLAVPRENELAFVFTDEHGETSFTNTFIYDPKTNTWENRLDNVVKGEAKPFARFKLTKQ